MTAFHEVQFPQNIAYGASGGAEFYTNITTTVAGFEQRNINWKNARGRWDISTGIKNKKDMDAVIAFFRARMGRAYGFRFKDWSDYQSLHESLGIGDSKQIEFQLVKSYLSGEYEYKRIIKKPVIGSVTIYLNDKHLTSGFTVDYIRGIITFTKAPSKKTKIIADFEFDVPVRFDTDRLNVRLERYGQYVWDSIPIVEVRV